MDRDKRIWYLSPMRAAKVQASLRIPAGHAQLKFVLTECSKTQIRLTGPKCTCQDNQCRIITLQFKCEMVLRACELSLRTLA